MKAVLLTNPGEILISDIATTERLDGQVLSYNFV